MDFLNHLAVAFFVMCALWLIGRRMMSRKMQDEFDRVAIPLLDTLSTVIPIWYFAPIVLVFIVRMLGLL